MSPVLYLHECFHLVYKSQKHEREKNAWLKASKTEPTLAKKKATDTKIKCWPNPFTHISSIYPEVLDGPVLDGSTLL